jgi:hypothetical protein
MARRRRFSYKKFRQYGARSSARYFYGRAGGYKGIAGNKWVTFGAGALAGFKAPQVIPYQDELALVITAAPVKIPLAVRSVASGYLIGRVVRNVMARGVGTGTSGNTGWL